MSLGMCGLDRCYMGQWCLGILKAGTVGGFLVWHALDVCLVYSNGIQKSDHIDSFGFKADFTEDSIKYAYVGSIIGIVILVIQFISTMGRIKLSGEVDPQEPGHGELGAAPRE